MSAELGYLGLGSNLGDRRELLQAAVEDLWAHGIRALAASSVYETEPVGEVLEQPPFLNACLRIETRHGPEGLLDGCKAVERALGRVAGDLRHGPRPVDVDVLLLGTEAYTSERIEIPHRELANRRFVLVPLLELDPELRLPDGSSLAAALAALVGQQVRRAGPPLELRG